jgi:hypothetical protein
MEPTTKIIIAMIIAYTPFFWYWISVIRAETQRTDADRRKYKRSRKHYWGEE